MKNKGTRADYHAKESIHRKETTRDERVRIIAWCDSAKMSWKEIQRHTGVDYRTCQSIYARAQATGTPSNRHQSGRPLLFTEEEKERLRLFVTREKKTRRMMWEDIIQQMGYNCSVRTLRDALASMGYHKRIPRKKYVRLGSV